MSAPPPPSFSSFPDLESLRPPQQPSQKDRDRPSKRARRSVEVEEEDDERRRKESSSSSRRKDRDRDDDGHERKDRKDRKHGSHRDRETDREREKRKEKERSSTSSKHHHRSRPLTLTSSTYIALLLRTSSTPLFFRPSTSTRSTLSPPTSASPQRHDNVEIHSIETHLESTGKGLLEHPKRSFTSLHLFPPSAFNLSHSQPSRLLPSILSHPHLQPLQQDSRRAR